MPSSLTDIIPPVVGNTSLELTSGISGQRRGSPRRGTGPLMFSVGDGAGITVNIGTVRGDVNILRGKGLCRPSQPKPATPPKPDRPVRCAKDVRQCPDGSYVRRVGRDCKFSPCPPGSPGDSMVRLVNNASEVAEKVFSDGLVRQFLEGVGTGAWVWKQVVQDFGRKLRVNDILAKSATYPDFLPVTPGNPYPPTVAVIRFAGDQPQEVYVGRFMEKYRAELEPLVSPGGQIAFSQNVSFPVAGAEQEKKVFDISMQASMDSSVGGEVVVSFDQLTPPVPAGSVTGTVMVAPDNSPITGQIPGGGSGGVGFINSNEPYELATAGGGGGGGVTGLSCRDAGSGSGTRESADLVCSGPESRDFADSVLTPEDRRDKKYITYKRPSGTTPAIGFQIKGQDKFMTRDQLWSEAVGRAGFRSAGFGKVDCSGGCAPNMMESIVKAIMEIGPTPIYAGPSMGDCCRTPEGDCYGLGDEEAGGGGGGGGGGGIEDYEKK